MHKPLIAMHVTPIDWLLAGALFQLFLHSSKKLKKGVKAPVLPPFDWGFADLNRPLVIDLECAFGASLLGLAQGSEGSTAGGVALSECNFIGAGSTLHAVAYGNGLAERSVIAVLPATLSGHPVV